MTDLARKKWVRLFASAFHQRAMISKNDALRLARVALKTFEAERCVECGVNPNRGGEQQGAYLCEECFVAA